MAARWEEGEKVFVCHLGLWSKGVYIRQNADGTHQVRIGKSKVSVRHWHVQSEKRGH